MECIIGLKDATSLMKFKYRAFIENTPEMREWLERLGYTPLRFSLNGKYLYARSCTWANKDHTWEEPYFETGNDIEEYSHYIDCRSNPDLFKAVTSIREDSDKWQLFTDGVKWTLCYEESILMWRDIYNFPDKNLIHKATLTELKEHFNKKIK